jgi:hypothetical protein
VTIFNFKHFLRQSYAPALLSLVVGITGCADSNNNNDSTVAVPAANFEGPVSGKPTYAGTLFDPATVGYQEEEYFIEGTANSYINVNELDSAGYWQVEASEQADYRSRIIVMRPIDPAQFNGTVIVEWLNVSATFDSAPDWGMAHTELTRSGYIWVGVSAQEEGVEALITGSADAILFTNSGDRYSSLMHPGDSFSYDIFSQVGQLLRNPAETNPLGGLAVEQILAAGESQSAGRLMTYLNALTPLHALYDGYFVHSRTGGSAPLQGSFFEPEAGSSTINTPDIVRVRDDLDVPVMMLQTESDLFILGSYPSNQEDSSVFRLWEVAGTAHADLYTFLASRFDTGNDPSIAAVVENAAPIPGFIECPVPVNAGPQHFVVNAAIDALNTWAAGGQAPSQAERLSVAGEPAAFILDDLGNVQGGIRTPYVDAPIAILSGGGQPQPDFDPDARNFCFLSGTTQLFDASVLASLYASNSDYIKAANTATDAAVANGFLLPADADLIKAYTNSTDIFSP